MFADNFREFLPHVPRQYSQYQQSVTEQNPKQFGRGGGGDFFLEYQTSKANTLIQDSKT